VTEETLFIALSYSGNTFETFSCFSEAVKRNCTTISMSSGGKLEDHAKKAQYYVKVPPNLPPRTAMAYLLFPLLSILSEYKLVKKQDVSATLKIARQARTEMRKSICFERNEAKQFAKKIKGIPLIYASDFFSPVAKRWRQQFNENAKHMAFDFSLPDANHNEIMAWTNKVKGDYTCIFLHNNNENEKVSKKFDFMREIYGTKAHLLEFFAEGRSKLAQLIYAVYMGDFVSTYFALLKGVNPTPVPLICELKRRTLQ
jgi:glucose/mannose-6-phosphate isomerase